MPELAEVQILVNQLRPRIRGRTIAAIEVRDPKIKLSRNVAGTRIVDVRRRAKFIIIELSGGLNLLVHLRMTGWFEFTPPPKYRLAIRTTGGTAYFGDSRRFGTIEVLTTAELQRALAPLGPEPLDRQFDLSPIRATTRAIKVALLDQRLVAGIGNIYANEALWRAKIHPRRRADRLRPDELRRLRRGIVVALRKGIAYGPRIFEVQTFAVYDRNGKPCRRCRQTIKRIVLAQRSTFFCPRCQRLRGYLPTK